MCNITPQVSQRICKHMNEDHGVSIYAMVLSTLGKSTANSNGNSTTEPTSAMKISNCKLKNVSMTQIELSYVACDSVKGVCMPKDVVIPFDPPLASSAEVRLVTLLSFFPYLLILFCLVWFYL